VRENFALPNLSRLSRAGFVEGRRERAEFQRYVEALRIKIPHAEERARNLSGGNQQKVVFAKELLQEPRLLLLDEPTRGVDVGAKGEIYLRLRALTEKGLGVLVASSELPELIGLCDRIIVMRKGCSIAEFPGGVDEDALLESATGLKAEAA
jgi:ribose transport system ATP-binding protein